MKNKIVLLCKNLYFNLPCIKYGRGSGWAYYDEILNIHTDPRGEKKSVPKWVKPWVWNLSTRIADALMSYMKKNKAILKEHYRKTQRL